MYSSYRNEILKAAQSAPHLLHKAHQHSLTGSEEESLFTDYFYSSTKQKKVLLHISGVHGVEGYIGSLIQRQILSSLSGVSDLPFQLVIVHAVNPYGMSWFHRTNSNNVDLNRNGLKQYNLSNPYYFHFKKFLTAKNLFQQILEFFKVLPVIAKIGIAQTVRSVASGQSEFPDSLFFSGKNLQEELSSFVHHLKSIIAEDAEIYALDVHSGLGKLKEETLIVDTSEGVDTAPFFKECFQTFIFDPLKTKSGYPAYGCMASLLRQHWSPHSVFHIFQEFGTRPFMSVLTILNKQTQFVFIDSKEEKSKQLPALKEKMLYSFFPNENQWQESCINLGFKRFEQLKNKLILS